MVDRQQLSEVLGVIACVALGGGLTYLLSPLGSRSRLWRAAVWFWAWGLGGWAQASVRVLVEGYHHVRWIRGSGGWADVYWTPRDVRMYAIFLGAFAAVMSFWLPRFGASASPAQ